MSSYVVGAAAVGWFSAAMGWLAMLLELYELEFLNANLNPYILSSHQFWVQKNIFDLEKNQNRPSVVRQPPDYRRR
ncbi:hypothetical protein ACFX2H_038531 [Malus domestica]